MITNVEPKLTDPDLEKSMVGYLIAYPESVEETRSILALEDFAHTPCRLVYRAVCDLSSKGRAPDILSVVERLDERGDLAKVGGSAWVSALTNNAPVQNIEYHCGQLRALGLRRALLTLSAQINSQAGNPGIAPAKIVEEAEQVLLKLTERRIQDPYRNVGDLLLDVAQDIDRRRGQKTEYSGVPSGFRDLDKLTDGFQPADFIVLGARPGVGKSAFAMGMAANQAFRLGKRVGFFSLEMSARSLAYRLIAGEARVNSEKLRTAMVTSSDIGKILEFGTRAGQASLYVSDVANMPISDLRAITRRMRARHAVDIVYVDYISLIEPDDKSIPRHEQIAAISRSLKQLAREVDIPIVALSQVRRESEGRKPALSDLRESGSLEQDSDIVLLLHQEEGVDETECLVAKHRNGPTGTVPLVFLKPFVRFEARERHG